MSGPGPAPGAAAKGSCGPGLSPDTIRRHLRHSEAKRLELERKLMGYIQSDAYQIKMKRMKLEKYLKEIEERQKRARVRNQALLKEFDEFEAHLKTSSSEMNQKMAWYEREIKRASSLREGDSSAAGGKEGAAREQVLRAGRPSVVSTRAAVSPAGASGALQRPLQPTESRSAPGLSLCSPSLGGLGPHGRSADLGSGASAEGAVSFRDPAAGEESSKQPISSASDPKPGSPEEGRLRGSVPGPKPLLSTRWPCEAASRESSAEPPIPMSTEEVIPRGPALPAAGGERGRAACAAQGPPLHPQTLPWARSAPHSFCTGAGDLEAREAAVLHQLRALFPGAPNGCLPPEKTLHAEGRAARERQTRPEQREAAVLQTHLSNHAKHQAQLPEEVSEMLERLLLSEGAQDGQAAPEERTDRSPAQSAEPSRSSPCGPRDGGDPAAKQAPQLARGTAERGRGAGDNGSKAKGSQEMRLETSSSSNERSPPFPRTESRKGTVTAIKSKAFWGESDDSSSEIEAALRPQSHSPEADEFDDFYD
ncbi:centrosomal protein kizuna isoform X2 [Patagioenas fasciata]|uniref:centrosomal protein kizuna isoform X2 n=2 Tax=Patagioenas fasciata TaxID=372321 RepID=UPI003A9942E3